MEDTGEGTRNGASPTVSVVIPVYNQADLLDEALESIDAQTFDDVEAIVVDDGSEEDYSAVLDGYGEWVRVVTHDRNRGAAEARNTGMDHARGTYIAFLDADDLWRSTKLEKQVEVFEHGDDHLGLVYTGFVQYELDGFEWTRYPTASGDVYVQELERDRIHPTSTVMIKRACTEVVGGFDRELPSRQDYDLWIRITERFTVSYVDEVLVEKREQPDSISKDFERRVQGDRAVMEKVRERIRGFGFVTRNRILAYHHHVLGRDYESNGDRALAVKHLVVAILRYPVRPASWVMLVITLLGIDRNGTVLTAVKNVLR